MILTPENQVCIFADVVCLVWSGDTVKHFYIFVFANIWRRTYLKNACSGIINFNVLMSKCHVSSYTIFGM